MRSLLFGSTVLRGHRLCSEGRPRPGEELGQLERWRVQAGTLRSRTQNRCLQVVAYAASSALRMLQQELHRKDDMVLRTAVERLATALLSSQSVLIRFATAVHNAALVTTSSVIVSYEMHERAKTHGRACSHMLLDQHEESPCFCSLTRGHSLHHCCTQGIPSPKGLPSSLPGGRSRPLSQHVRSSTQHTQCWTTAERSKDCSDRCPRNWHMHQVLPVQGAAHFRFSVTSRLTACLSKSFE